MNPNGQPRPRELTDEALGKEFTIKFTRRELTVLYNLIFRGEYRLPDAKLLIDIVGKIESPVVALTNQDYKDSQKPEKTPELITN